MMHTDLTNELDGLRLTFPGILAIAGTKSASYLPDVSKGMAAIFEDTPASLPVGVFTASFAERFCRETPGYVWREL